MDSISTSLFPTTTTIPAAYGLRGPLNQTTYLVNGELRHWAGPQQEVYSPILTRQNDGGLTPTMLGSYPSLDERAALEILDAAVAAYDGGRGEWPTMSVEGRIRHVQTFVKHMADVRSDVVKLLMWEIGKSASDAAKEFDRTVQYIDDTIVALKDLNNRASVIEQKDGIAAQIRRSPLGAVLCMGPFNYPLNETYTTLIPALIMGNTAVLKPAKYGVLLHEPLLAAYQASFPPGVINTVYGDGPVVIGPMMSSGRVDVLAFIGSSKVADILQKQHPNPHHLEAILGLDAKNPAIVCADADLDLATTECVQGALSYNGQRCTALKMLFVHTAIYDAFVDKFIQKVDKLVVGMPWDKDVSITPLAEQGKTDYLRGLVDDAKTKGAVVVNKNGGEIVGSLFRPAVLSPVTSSMRIYHEEQFGPVVPVIPFDNLRVPLEYVSASQYGQQASIFSNDPSLIGTLIDPLANQVSRININSQCQRGPDVFPFTGRKRSAKRTLSVSDALRAFSIRSMVATKSTDTNKRILDGILRDGTSRFLTTDVVL